MQLSPGEHSILAYFPSTEKALDAAGALKSMGISDVQVDRVSRFGVTTDEKYNDPIAGQAESLTGLTLFSGSADQSVDNDSRILMGADPSVEGYTSSEYGLAGGKSFLVTIVTNEENLDAATQLLKEKGAYF